MLKARFEIAWRRFLLTVLLVLMPRAFGWAEPYATDPATAASSPDTPAYSAPAGITGPTSAFHDSVASRYNYAFGKNSPFLPSNATTANGQFFSPKAFPTAQYCGHCHQEAYRQWRQSVHSNSFRAPW
jgi:hypothetical protein